MYARERRLVRAFDINARFEVNSQGGERLTTSAEVIHVVTCTRAFLA
jgi:hypothetical protein